MTDVTTAPLAESPASHSDSEDWVLTLPLEHLAVHRHDEDFVVSRGSLSGFFEGVLHDRDELAAAVGLPRLDNDAELMLAAYARWGEAMLQRLRGCFALCIIDRTRDLAIVARDPLGAHPLYYATRGRSVLFSNATRHLLASPGISGELHRVALADRLAQRWPDPGETYFAAVRRIPPGSRALIVNGRMKVLRYWDPAPEGEAPNWLSADDAARFDNLLDRAVERCLRTGPSGIFLSGGLDSISIAAVAATLSKKANHREPLALSLGFPDPGCDERIVQTAVARELGLRHVLADFDDAVGPRGLLAQTVELNDWLAAPVLNTWAPAYFALARHAERAGVRTILTGSGGDEWMTVSPYLAADLIRRGDLVSLMRLMADWRRSYGSPWLRIARNLTWTYGLRPVGGMILHRLAPAAWNARRSRRMTRHDPVWVAPDPSIRAAQRERAPGSLGPSDPPHGFYLQEVRGGLDHSIVALELEEQYQFGQRLGLRFMHPYWDADLVDMLYRLRPEHLNRNGRSKGLVRETLSQRFPTLGLERQHKVVASTFFRSLVQREGPLILKHVGPFTTLGALGVVDAKLAADFVQRSFADSSAQPHHAWELLNLETWARAQLRAPPQN